MMTKTEAEAIASLVHTLRPDWDHRGVMAALAQVRDKPPFSVALAALRAARTPANRTPAVISLAGLHWRDPNGETPTPPKAGTTYRRVLDPEATARGVANARAAMRVERDRVAAERAAWQAQVEAARNPKPGPHLAYEADPGPSKAESWVDLTGEPAEPEETR